MGDEDVVSDSSLLDKGRLIFRDQVWKDLFKPIGKQFRDYLVVDIAKCNWSIICNCFCLSAFRNQSDMSVV